MSRSSEFRDARVVIVGAPGSGCEDLLGAITRRWGGESPERVEGGAWSLLRSEVASHGLRIDLCCLEGECAYHGVQSALVESADAVIVMINVAPDCLVEARQAYDRLRPVLERCGGPWLVQYHRIEREPRFVAGKLDCWLEIDPARRCRDTTCSDAPDVPGGAFDRLVGQLVEQRLV